MMEQNIREVINFFGEGGDITCLDLKLKASEKTWMGFSNLNQMWWKNYPRELQRESISSMKIVLGAYALARSNKHRTIRSLSPRHFEANVAEETLKNVVPHSVATALASSVFPVPGGPNMRTPFQGLLIPYKQRSNMLKPTSLHKRKSFNSRRCRK